MAEQGFHKGTVAMVVVAVLLAIWICIVWWQDKRTAALVQEGQTEEVKTVEIEIPEKL